MTQCQSEILTLDRAAICQGYEGALRALARRAVRVWFNHQRLDEALAAALAADTRLDGELIYAIGADGRQVSSNVTPSGVDPGAYHQDLSTRPYSVPPAVLHNTAFQGAFLCETYISQLTQLPCATLLYGVTSGPTALGFLAMDIDPARYICQMVGSG